MIDKDIQQRICKAADKLEQDYVLTLQQLVRVPSVVGNEAQAQRFMAELYRSFGLDVVVFEAQIDKISNHPAFINTGESYENRPNVIGIFSGDSNSHSIILNGHIDVVSPEPIDRWSRNPLNRLKNPLDLSLMTHPHTGHRYRLKSNARTYPSNQDSTKPWPQR